MIQNPHILFLQVLGVPYSGRFSVQILAIINFIKFKSLMEPFIF